MSHVVKVCLKTEHLADQAHHHTPQGDWMQHRHPGCPWDCPEAVWVRALPEAEEPEKEPEEAEAPPLPPKDRDAIDGATEALAGIMGHLAGHFAGTADLARQDLEAVTKERDKAVHLLKSMVSILDGMAYTPTFAANGRDWDDARDFLEAIARDDKEG